MKLQLLQNDKQLTILEAHSGLSALLVEKSKWDGIWISSLTHSAIKGLPDNELVPLKERVDLVAEIRKVSTKPIVVDIDTGGELEHLPFIIKWFEQAGANAVVIEDKKYPKQNSLLLEGQHELEEIDKFCGKIRVAKAHSKDMLIIARLESLIAKKSMYEALLRADAYEKAGADAIVIHSKEQISCNEVMEFATEFRKKSNLPLVAIPTTYNLPEEHPFNMIITANHLLRASLNAMQRFVNGEGVELTSVKSIFELLGH